jgi:hypothetical protein
MQGAANERDEARLKTCGSRERAVTKQIVSLGAVLLIVQFTEHLSRKTNDLED